MNNWTEISPAALVSNFHALQEAAGEAVEVLAVVKANAYGHGAELCSQILVQAGARWLGATSAAEGERIRAVVGDGPEILVMCGSLPEDVPAIARARLTPVVWTLEQVRWLAEAHGLKVHVEVDTGMGRQGVPPGAALGDLLREIAAAGMVLDGLMTHFCSSEVAGDPLTLEQEGRFEAAVAQVRRAGFSPRWIHAGNSSSLDNPAQPWPWLANLAEATGARAMVRSGIALYGFCLPIESRKPTEDVPRHLVQPCLEPVMSWFTRVLAIRDLAPGDTVGYNATFRAEAPMRVALLPVGYADGLRRELSSTGQRAGGWVMVAGQRAPILGRISMNLTVVDVSAIPAVQAGDLATVLGDGISAEDHARCAGTIVYEIVCGIHPSG